jgi:hypothetical protein
MIRRTLSRSFAAARHVGRLAEHSLAPVLQREARYQCKANAIGRPHLDARQLFFRANRDAVPLPGLDLVVLAGVAGREHVGARTFALNQRAFVQVLLRHHALER